MAQRLALGHPHFIPFAVTIVAIVFTDVLRGIGVGVVVGVAFVVVEHLRSPVLSRVSPPGTRVEIDGRRTTRVNHDPLDVLHIFKAAMSGQQHGLVDHWLGPIRNVLRWNARELDAIADPQARFDRLVELNVLEQLYHLSETPIIQQAWARGRRPLLHGLVYDLKEGLLHEIATGVDSQEAADHLANRRLSGVAAGPPPLGRVAGPILAGEGLADEIADRVFERLNGVSVRRR